MEIHDKEKGGNLEKTYLKINEIEIKKEILEK
jgi:hypothetical protein